MNVPAIELDLSVRTTIVEALGWFFHSWQQEKIQAMCDQLVTNPATPETLKLQAEKTRRILKEYNLGMK